MQLAGYAPDFAMACDVRARADATCTRLAIELAVRFVKIAARGEI